MLLAQVEQDRLVRTAVDDTAGNRQVRVFVVVERPIGPPMPTSTSN